jgi:DNA-binding Lrp family transcriptional regulator
MDIDDLDRKILAELQYDAALTHQSLARKVGASTPTVQRRVKRLKDRQVIDRMVSILDPKHVGQPLIAIVEISLSSQSAEALDRFEAMVCALAEVQQCYQVSTGPDFILILAVTDMDHYQAFANTHFRATHDVRNVRTFFSIKRSKFGTVIPIRR